MSHRPYLSFFRFEENFFMLWNLVCHHHHLVTITTATISRQPGCDPYLSFFGLLFSFIIITVIVITQVTIRPKWYCLGAQIEQPDLRGWTSDHVFADHFLHVGDDGHHKLMTIRGGIKKTVFLKFLPLFGGKFRKKLGIWWKSVFYDKTLLE